jgi:hypothetical protein
VSSHDPRREVEKLRDQLASHERAIAFLIGAGGSSAVRDPNGHALIPAVAALGEMCADAVGKLGSEHKAVYGAIAEQVEDAPSRRPRAANIEEILSAVRLAIGAMGDDDSVAGGTKAQLAEIEEAIRTTIARAALPNDERVPPKLPHHALARWVRRAERKYPVEIFTTNYDTLLERALEDERVPFYDGFAGARHPFFLGSPPSQDGEPGRAWTRLWKIHGSVNWSWYDAPDGNRRIVRAAERPDGELILPSFHKYDESRRQPYASMLDRLRRALTERGDALLIVVGFSFSDEHLNAVIFDALENRGRLLVVALQHGDPDSDHEIAKRASSLSNLVVLGPSTAIVAGRRGEWLLQEPVDSRTAELLDIPFDSDAAPEKDDVARTGRFRLGDFNWLARFLDSMPRSDV